GLGTTVALPLLDAMLPAFQRSAPPPIRLMYVYAPTGMIPTAWYPSTTGSDFEFSRIMKPLEKFRKDVLVVSGLGDNPGRSLGDGPGDHSRAVASYLTGVHPKKTEGTDIRCGISADQVAARSLGQQTRFASLEVTCEDSRQLGACDSYSCAYQTISWKSETQPLPPEMNPRLLFERLFGDLDVSANPTERANQEFFRQSILDRTQDTIRSLTGTLGPTDRRKLDEYLTCIRELEARLQRSGKETGEIPEGIAKPDGIPASFAEHSRLIFDLIRIAFQTDMTRVATFMLAREGGVRPYPEIGVPEAHHSISHHGNNPVLVEKITKIECYHMEQFAYFMEKLKSSPEGDGSMLDHCAIVYGASMGDPNRHDHGKCPTIIAGNACGRISGGRHVSYEKETPMTNLHLSLLDVVGVPTDRLGDANGKVDFLTEL
ncbi:MAG TPA: DUF1552 domain-containing protein, partial [Bryobacteraceae bacterium]|nr:DUF1552 domain-containing protein [Bryobacteraceae bacterium]